jgi:uncharacterized secreted protein with C-terminal beta-propeller domain
MNRIAVGIVAGVLVLGTWGCDEGGGNHPLIHRNMASLKSLGSCEDATAELRASLIRKMEASLKENRQKLSGNGGHCWLDDRASAGSTPTYSPSPTSSGTEAKESSASSYSTTNNQVLDVDEADFVKNDGKSIFILADGKLKVLNAWPPSEMRTVSALPIEGQPKKLYVYGDRALVFSGITQTSTTESGRNTFGGYFGSRECTYGYDCDFGGDGMPLKLTLVDLTDRSAPRVLRETRMSGAYVNARRVGGAVHIVTLNRPITVEGLQLYPSSYNPCVAPNPVLLDAEFEQLRVRNIQRIMAMDFSQGLPSLDDRWKDGAVQLPNPFDGCASFYASNQGDGHELLSIVSMDMTTAEPMHATTVVGRAGAVYATGERLYIAARHQYLSGSPWFWEEPSENGDATTVHGFELAQSPPSSFYGGSGVVKGRILNQFSMDEFNGDLRIATSSGHLPNPNVHSTVSVLRPDEKGLATIGVVDHLAPAEDIRSVRFQEERGYVVTFKKTDPLFVLDFSNPSTPTVLGELKIPGFSTYMHPLDKGHILSIGFDAADQGSFAFFQGMLLQIFDVTEPTQPKLMHRQVIGTRGSASDAATDHLAFNYFAPKGLLAIPIAVCEGGTTSGMYGTTASFNGLYLYDVSLTEGFHLRGGLSHPSPLSSVSCGNWWTSSTSTVQRSIFMDDYVYSISNDFVQAASTANVSAEVSRVTLTQK